MPENGRPGPPRAGPHGVCLTSVPRPACRGGPLVAAGAVSYVRCMALSAAGRRRPPLMTTRAVHWHEEMFLRPHHFQAAQRHWRHLADRGEKWDLQYNWGLRAIDLDLDALGNYRFVVRSLEARLRD